MIQITISMTDAIFAGGIYIIALGLTWFAVTDIVEICRK